MAPQFLRILSILDIVQQMLKAMSAAERGQSGSAIIAGERIEFKDREEFDNETKRIGPKMTPILTEALNSLSQSGLMHLVPWALMEKFFEAVKLAAYCTQSRREFDVADKKFEEAYAVLRKMVGLTLEKIPT